VGLGGLVSGGGIGWMVRQHGLTIDSLVGVELVTADGEVVPASEHEHPDLFWAVRGGGGNFGIVTRFDLRLQPVGMVLGGAIILPPTREAIRRCMDYAAQAPDGLTTNSTLMPAPPLPIIPAEVHGSLVFVVLFCYTGDLDEGERVVQPLREAGTPLGEVVKPMPYPAMFSFTEEGTARGPSTVRSTFIESLPDELIDILLDSARQGTSPLSMLQLRVLGGAMARVSAEATAFAHRDKPLMLTAINAWSAGDVAAHLAWTERLWSAVRPYGRGVYANFLGIEGADRVGEAYPGATYERLRVVKRRYDPTNTFHLNQNIRP
jgi:FAD/FMN-containing dehydrogenase